MEKITGIILAGGKSSRMGSEKGLLELNGKSFMQHIIDAVKQVVDDIIIVANNSHYDKLGYPVFADLVKECGPMGGIYTGLKRSTTKKNLVVSCDIPDITPEILRQIIDQSDEWEVTAPLHNGLSEPLCAVYNISCIDKLKSFLDKGEFKMRDALMRMNANYVNLISESHPAEQNLININTPEQLRIRKLKIK